MSEGTTFCAVMVMIMCYCVPMLKRMDDLERRIAKMEKQLDEIKKALYVMPESEEQNG